MSEKDVDGKTIGELYGPAMSVTGQAEADRHLEGLVSRHLRLTPGCERAEAERVVRQNLAYYAGYYDTPTRERVERLFCCAHPIFGPVADSGPPTTNSDLAAGLKRMLGVDESVVYTDYSHEEAK